MSAQTTAPVQTGGNGQRWFGYAAMGVSVLLFVLGVYMMFTSYSDSNSGFNTGFLLAAVGFVGGIAAAVVMTIKFGGTRGNA